MIPISHLDAVTGQFGSHAAAYLTSPTHAAGEDLDLIEARIRQRRPAVVLDLGTGGGHAAFRAAAAAQHVVAYDPSAAMLSAVAAEAAKRGLGNIETRQGVAEALPFDDGSFDAVITRFSAHHWQDLPRALRETRRVLKPGGLALVCDTIAPERALCDTWLQAIELLRDPTHVRNYRQSEWMMMLAGAGFAPLPARLFRLRLEFASWVARSSTGEKLVAAILALELKAPAEVADHFALEADGSFTIDEVVIEG